MINSNFIPNDDTIALKKKELHAYCQNALGDEVNDIFISNKGSSRENTFYCIRINNEMIDYRLFESNKKTTYLFSFNDGLLSKNNIPQHDIIFDKYMTMLNSVQDDIKDGMALVFTDVEEN